MTSADAAPLTWTYVGEAVGFMGLLLALFVYAVWATRDGRKGFVERWLDSPRQRRRRDPCAPLSRWRTTR